MKFEKWQALGNDYLIVERDRLPFALTPARVRRLCHRHFGPGADGVLLISAPANPEHVADLRIFNPDGSEAELSGNGAREAIMFLRTNGWTDRDQFTILTPAGEIHPTITGPDMCTVDIGPARLVSPDFPGGPPDGRGELTSGEPTSGEPTWRFRHVSIGNPQCAIHVATEQELAGLDLDAIGPGIEGHQAFPNRTNVSWYTELAPGRSKGDAPPAPPGTPAGVPSDARTGEPTGVHTGARIRARIYERGVGQTMSSGTGATGAAVAYVLERDPPTEGEPQPRPGPARVTVVLDGGELEVEVGQDLGVKLTGWARPVYEGYLSRELTAELRETGQPEGDS